MNLDYKITAELKFVVSCNNVVEPARHLHVQVIVTDCKEWSRLASSTDVIWKENNSYRWRGRVPDGTQGAGLPQKLTSAGPWAMAHLAHKVNLPLHVVMVHLSPTNRFIFIKQWNSERVLGGGGGSNLRTLFGPILIHTPWLQESLWNTAGQRMFSRN